MSVNKLEEGFELLLDFEKLKRVAICGASVIPVAVQDVESKDVLLVGYANAAALEYTLKNRIAAFWSTSRNEIWIKGLTSGDILNVVDIRVNCEQNSLLYLVKLQGIGSCHTKGKDQKARMSCYYRRIVDGKLEFVS